MLKKIISPVQHWLLKRGQCVGCGMPLAKARVEKTGAKTKVHCNCGRIFVKEHDTYRRALFEEV